MSHLQLAAAYFSVLFAGHLSATERDNAADPEAPPVVSPASDAPGTVALTLRVRGGGSEPITVERAVAPEHELPPDAQPDAELPTTSPPVFGVHEVAYATYDVVSCTRPPWAVAPQARIVPSFRNGTSVGFKLYGIRPGSIYEQLGIKNGDVVTHLNGMDLTSPDKALMIYSRLKEARRFYVELERGGVPLTLTYRLEDGVDCL